MDIRIELTKNPKEKPDPATLGFGQHFSDHMLLIDYDVENGWHDARIVPFGPISLHPAATVFHYGEECFEGLKAYRTADGTVQMFRPIENVRRMNSSCNRLCLPEMPEDMMYEAMLKFVEVEKDWVPEAPGCSLYIRPFMFGNDETLGVHAVKHSVFCVIASPSGSYYKEGINPVKIMIEDEDVRAVRGGTGYTKCGGNYAASTRAGKKAEDKGYSQVLWLDGVERKYIEEVGAMNVMFKIGDEIITPELNGSILPGITRKSIVEFCKAEGIRITERKLSLEELTKAAEDGTLVEAWGCGTAAVVSPIGELRFKDHQYVVNGGRIGETTQYLYDRLTAIQWGREEDKFGWIVKIG